MLQDRKTYQPITDERRNPTTRTTSELQRKLQDLNNSGNLFEEEYKKLQVSDPNPAPFRGLQQFHKGELQADNNHFRISTELNGTSLSPINSCIGAPTYQVSKYLAKVLRTLQVDDQFTVQSSTEFTEFVLSQRVTDYEELVSFDVILLFTSNPVNEAPTVLTRPNPYSVRRGHWVAIFLYIRARLIAWTASSGNFAFG